MSQVLQEEPPEIVPKEEVKFIKPNIFHYFGILLNIYKIM